MHIRSLVLAFVFLPLVAEAGSVGPKRSVAALFGQRAEEAGPGCAISVTRHDKPVFAQAWGKANLEQVRPNRLDTVFEAGSVSKQFAAAAVAVLIDQGKLTLDDDVRRTIPELPDYGTPISVRQLLTHTSGVRNWDDLVELAGRPREDASGFSQADALAIIARQQELNFTPGSQYLYSNSNYVLAAVLVERISGQSLREFSAKALFEPAGMAATRWRDDYTRVEPNRATAYTPDDRGILHIDMPAENVVGPGGLLTTVGDLQRWNAVLEHPSATARGWVSLLTSTRGSLSDGTAIRYGLGLEYEELRDRAVISHAGATAGYRAYLARVPAESLSVAILCNAGALNTEELGPKVVEAFLPRAAPTPPTVIAKGKAPSDVAGRYFNATTRALVTAVVDDVGAHLNGGVAFHEVTPGSLRSADGLRRLDVTRTQAGAIAQLSVSRVGNSAVVLRPAPAWAPSAETLAALAGEYVSAEVEATWHVTVAGNVLRASGPRGETFALDPIYTDTFAARDASWTLAFERDAAGAIGAVRFYKTRTLGVRFLRRSRGD